MLQVVFLSVVVMLCLLPARDAWAYLDPGTGSFMLQAVIAVVMGALLALKQYWAKLRRFLSPRRDDPPESDRE